MERNAILGIMLALLLTSMLMLPLSIQPVKASGTIYIRANGLIDPPTAPISSVDNITYTFTDNIYDSIVVERNNIVVNGSGYTLDGVGGWTGWTGIDLTGRSNVTIKNMKIKDFKIGVWLNSTSNSEVSGNTITHNWWGMYHYHSSSNKISENVLTSNNVTIFIEFSSNANIYGNNVTNNVRNGIGIHRSSYNVLRNNLMINNSYNLEVLGLSLNEFIQDIDWSNTVDGKPVRYWISKQGLSVPLDAGYVALVNCSNIMVSKLNLTKNGYPMLLAYTTDSTITQNYIANNRGAIELIHSSSNRIYANNITTNINAGISLEWSQNNSVLGNNLTENQYGIIIFQCSNNVIYHNNLINNTQQILTDSVNIWDDGYPSGGNYWSNYIGIDEKCGPYQNYQGSDGIGDTPHIIDMSNQDKYPLTKPWTIPIGHNVAVISVVTFFKTIGGQGFSTNITVYATNRGEYKETFYITIYANTIPIASKSVTLESGAFTTVPFTWNTTGYIKGNYTISAYAWPVPSETDTADNIYIDGWIVISIYCDVNGDGIVDISDILDTALAFGSTPGHPRWNPNCDLDDNGIVDISDILEVALHFGETDP
jgi:parallel beta-helix repeat protein